MPSFDKLEVSTDSLVQSPPPGFVLLKKTRVIFVVIVVTVTIVAVGLLAGFLAAKHERKLAEEKYGKTSQGKDQGKKTPAPVTTKPAKQTTGAKATTTTSNPISTAAPCVGLWCSVRLPNDVIPHHYDLTIQAYVDDLKFNGTQVAHVTVNNSTKYILIHINHMKITSAKVARDTGIDIPLAKTFEYKENQFFVIETKDAMNPGNYRISLHYKANISKVLTGFYKSTYKAKSGVTRTLLTTKFQPTDARKAFPCFDEPDLKATFSITMIHPTSHPVALSNMPPMSNTTSNGWTVTKFGKTVRMSAYLVAFIVCDFEYKATVTGLHNNITTRVYSSPPQISNVDYALKTTREMLTFFEEFFKVEYVMPKLDQVAIPDYGSGATEHWGVITYRQTRLLYAQGISSERNKQSIATIIAHELAHLWFGNLVTCKWWNDLWVQEGMASYTEYYGMNHSHPDWQAFDQFIVSDLKRGLDLDALASSHPIVMPVSHPKQIKEIFDAITYSKGSSIIRMLDDFLGQDMFRNGLARYLTKHKFQGATSSDLWNAFSEVSNYDILGMMETWTLQMGFPVIKITRKSNTSTQTTLSQKHFLLDRKAVVTQKSPFKYIMPVSSMWPTGPLVVSQIS